jgi:hypothetical protein
LRLEQLAQQSLIEWNPYSAGIAGPDVYLAVSARIAAFGVDVVEGKVQPPLLMATA